MANLKAPFFSLAARGALNRYIVARRRGSKTVLEAKPYPKDAKTSAQLAWRTMYQLAVDLWHTLSVADKQQFETAARPHHMTGFAWFMSQALKPNPGIYLPLAGGTMAGQIAMATNRITDLPAPGAANDPLRQAELTSHAALDTGIHGLLGQVAYHARKTTNQSIPTTAYTLINWQSEYWDIGGYFDLANNQFKPLIPGKYLILASAYLGALASGKTCMLECRKNGTAYKRLNYHITSSYQSVVNSGSCIVDMNGSTDYVNFYFYHNHGSARTLYNYSWATWTAGFLIAQS